MTPTGKGPFGQSGISPSGTVAKSYEGEFVMPRDTGASRMTPWSRFAAYAVACVAVIAVLITVLAILIARMPQ